MKIESKSKYQQAKDVIFNYIAENKDKIDKLPSEQEFARLMGVSRNTIREAIKILEQENILFSKHGVGTFIVKSTSQLSTSINVLESWTKIITNHGYKPETQDVFIECRKADKKIAEKLKLNVGDKILYLERLRTADGQPVVFVSDYARYQEGIIKEYKKRKPESFLEFIESFTNLILGYVVCGMQPVIGSQSISKKLYLKSTKPLLYLEQIHYTQNGDPLFYSESYVLSEIFQFNIIRKRLLN